MILTNVDNCEKFSIVQCNKETSNILNISAGKNKSKHESIEKCSLQRPTPEMPKYLCTDNTLTAHLLPTAAIVQATSISKQSIHFSYLEQSQVSCFKSKNSRDNMDCSNSIDCCYNLCTNSCRNSDYSKRKIKHQQTLLKQKQSDVTTAYETGSSLAINIECSKFPPTFKFRHRKQRAPCNVNRHIANSSTVASAVLTNSKDKYIKHDLQQPIIDDNITASTAKPNPLMIKAFKDVRKSKYPLSNTAINTFRSRPLSGLKVTSFFSLLTLVCLETVLLSTVSNCAKTFYMHWNTSNSIFRIDNTDHIIDVNKGNLAFEFDQVHIICPVYEPGTFENETEKYIIYNVSKVEYETCRITNADPRVIAICDKPQKLMFFTITFRPFTPQPGGLEFLPGNDYYFISTSSKDDLYRRIGGRCSTNNMKVVFKVCCAPEDKSNKTLVGGGFGRNGANSGGSTVGGTIGIIDEVNNVGANGSGGLNVAIGDNVNQQHINSISAGLIPGSGINIYNGMQQKPTMDDNVGTIGTSINTNIDQFNRIPIQTNGINGIRGIGLGNQGSNGILLTPGGMGHGVSMHPGGNSASGIGINGHYPGHQQTGIRINNVPSQQHPSHKNNNNDDHYNKLPNEVVKNEELTYKSAGSTLHYRHKWNVFSQIFKTTRMDNIVTIIRKALICIDSIFKRIFHKLNKATLQEILFFEISSLFCFNMNPILFITVVLVILSAKIFQFKLKISSTKCSALTSTCNMRNSTKSSYLPIFSSNCSNKYITKDEFVKQCTNSTSAKNNKNSINITAYNNIHQQLR